MMIMAKPKRLDPLKISLIGIGALFVFFIAMILINRPESWEDHITSQSEEETYFVYVYSEFCSVCNEIADDVAAFTASNAMDMELVPVDVNNPTVPTPDDMSVPRVYVVHNGEITQTRIGKFEIIGGMSSTGFKEGIFNEVENGTFQP
jgi:hypothetical protein